MFVRGRPDRVEEMDSLRSLIVADGPLTCDQVPVPTPGVFPAIVAEPEVVQTVWSPPALAVVGPGVKVMTTSSVEAVQGAFAMVQRKV